MDKITVIIDGTYYEYPPSQWKRITEGDEDAPAAVLRWVIKQQIKLTNKANEGFMAAVNKLNERQPDNTEVRPRRTRKVQEGSQSTKSEDGSA